MRLPPLLFHVMMHIVERKGRFQMTILVDMDDTIEQLLRAWVRRVNEKYARQVTVDDVTDWNVAAPYPGLTRDQVYDVISEKGFWKSVEPMPGAQDALKHFLDAGHTVYIVTATPYAHLQEKMDDVLFRYFPFLTWDQVIVTTRKQLIRGDVLIDDGIHNLEGGNYRKILFTAPHNRYYDAAANGMIRVNSWEEAVRAIDHMNT